MSRRLCKANGLLEPCAGPTRTPGSEGRGAQRCASLTRHGTQSFGNAGDLMKVVVRDAAGTALDTKYYRYYTAGQSGGYQHGLRYEFGPQSYARLAAAFSD